jgi:hypothetical protein
MDDLHEGILRTIFAPPTPVGLAVAGRLALQLHGAERHNDNQPLDVTLVTEGALAPTAIEVLERLRATGEYRQAGMAMACDEARIGVLDVYDRQGRITINATVLGQPPVIINGWPVLTLDDAQAAA